MTISSLSQYTRISPNTSGLRTAEISKITVHHMAGDLDIWTCGEVFAPSSRQASSNYGVDSAGRIACYLPEEYHPWTSASYWNDDRAITIEVADYDCYNWVPSDAAYEATVQLCADICNRYGIEPEYDGSIYASFTEHRMFAPTSCPGPWWHDHMYEFVEDVKAAMLGEDMNVELTDAQVNRIAQKTWEYYFNGDTIIEDTMGIPSDKWYPNRYNVLNASLTKAADVEKKIDELSARIDKIAAGDVDYELLAKAVADELSKRMKE